MSLSLDKQSKSLSAKDNTSLTSPSVHRQFKLKWENPEGNSLENIRRSGSLKIIKEVLLNGTRTKWGTLMKEHIFLGQIFLAIVILHDYSEGQDIPHYIVEDLYFDVWEGVNRAETFKRWQTSDIIFTEKESNLKVYPPSPPAKYQFTKKEDEILAYLFTGIEGELTLLSRVRKHGSGWEVWFRGTLPEHVTYKPLKDFISSTEKDG